MEVINTIGRRKTAVARIYKRKGSGQITINNRDYKEYFTIPTLQFIVTQPLVITQLEREYYIKVNLQGGGTSGQAEALRLAISRGLLEVNEDFRSTLKAKGLLRRVPRMVERKYPGQPIARKKFQFSIR